MSTLVVRVWLPDRPGALGQVASRIGAVRGEIVGIDILERGAGRAIDELVVEVPEDHLVDLLVAEINQVDGVDVEEVRPVPDAFCDPRLEALDAAAIIVAAAGRDAILDAVVTHARTVLRGSWAAVVGLDGEATLVASVGETPPAPWLVAFVAGSQSSVPASDGSHGPDDVVWAHLPSVDLALVVGRDGTGYRARERRHAAALARIADQRLLDTARLVEPEPY